MILRCNVVCVCVCVDMCIQRSICVDGKEDGD